MVNTQLACRRTIMSGSLNVLRPIKNWSAAIFRNSYRSAIGFARLNLTRKGRSKLCTRPKLYPLGEGRLKSGFSAPSSNINLPVLGAVPDDVFRIVNALKGEMQSDGSSKSWKLTVMMLGSFVDVFLGSAPTLKLTLEECLHSLGVGRRDESVLTSKPKLSSDSQKPKN